MFRKSRPNEFLPLTIILPTIPKKTVKMSGNTIARHINEQSNTFPNLTPSLNEFDVCALSAMPEEKRREGKKNLAKPHQDHDFW